MIDYKETLDEAQSVYDYFLKKYKYIHYDVSVFKSALAKDDKKLREAFVSKTLRKYYDKYETWFKGIYGYDSYFDSSVYELSIRAGLIDLETVPWCDEMRSISQRVSALPSRELFELGRDILWSLFDTEIRARKLQYGMKYRGFRLFKTSNFFFPPVTKTILDQFQHNALLYVTNNINRIPKMEDGCESEIIRIWDEKCAFDDLDPDLSRNPYPGTLPSVYAEKRSDFGKLSEKFQELSAAYHKLNSYARLLLLTYRFQNDCVLDSIRPLSQKLQFYEDFVRTSNILHECKEFAEECGEEDRNNKSYWKKYDDHMEELRKKACDEALEQHFQLTASVQRLRMEYDWLQAKIENKRSLFTDKFHHICPDIDKKIQNYFIRVVSPDELTEMKPSAVASSDQSEIANCRSAKEASSTGSTSAAKTCDKPPSNDSSGNEINGIHSDYTSSDKSLNCDPDVQLRKSVDKLSQDNQSNNCSAVATLHGCSAIPIVYPPKVSSAGELDHVNRNATLESDRCTELTHSQNENKKHSVSKILSPKQESTDEIHRRYSVSEEDSSEDDCLDEISSNGADTLQTFEQSEKMEYPEVHNKTRFMTEDDIIFVLFFALICTWISTIFYG